MFRTRNLAIVGVIVSLLMVFNAVSFAQMYDVDNSPNVPDVDKPNPADNSCWLAAAANNLAAAGFGQGPDMQTRADNIYLNDLMPHFGNGAWTGWSSVAINWWLLNEGYNPGSTNYDPNVKYNDTTVVRKRLVATDYDFLLDELSQVPPQQVNVSFEIPGQEAGHEMTLVGGNRSPVFVPPTGKLQFSVWHDNQGDLTPPPGDPDQYTNTWVGGPPFWNIDRRQTPENPNDDWEAIGYTTLCPGIPKPADAMENYDIAWYKDMIELVPGDPSQGWAFSNRFRVAGVNGQVYTNDTGSNEPYWDSQEPVLIVPNEEIPNLKKEIWLSIDFIDRGRDALGTPIILIETPDGDQFNPDQVTWSDDGGQVLLHWTLDDQPEWEKVIFPDDSYRDLYDISTGLGGPVKDWNLATLCVPEPGSATMLLVGLVFIAGRGLRRRK